MTETNESNFSQRSGYEPVPEQLKLGQVSKDFRNLVHYAFDDMINRIKRRGVHYSYLEKKIIKDCHVKFFKESIKSYCQKTSHWKQILDEYIMLAKFNKLFDLIEFFISHPECDEKLKFNLSQSFIDARMAYRIKDDMVIAIGTDEQAQAVLQAFDDTEKGNHSGVRKHLIGAGKKLTDGDWKGSARDSIHSVEAMAVIIAPKGKTLGNALDKIEKNGNKIHPQLKKAFEKLYAYTNDGSTGVRHAEPLWNNDAVDQADALFMLGACASFVSYLIAKNNSPKIDTTPDENHDSV